VSALGRARPPLFLFLTALMVLIGCTSGSAGGRTELVVYAASSLTDAFPVIAGAFEDEHPDVRVIFNFSGSATLRSQLEFGAPADVYAAADSVQMGLAVGAGIVDSTIKVFASNSMAIVVPANEAVVNSPVDIGNPGVKVVLASDQVPAGAYTLEMLAKMDAARAAEGEPGFQSRVLSNVVSHETNVREVLAKVVLGEADVGFVYATDAARGPNRDRIEALAIPVAQNVTTNLFVGRVTDSNRRDLATEFIEFVTSNEGAIFLTDAGFGPAVPTRASGR
jgi:molybdate transport system substrate-binding protein